MECPACQHENPSEAHFCLKCGGALAVVCPKCEKNLPPDAAFCMACGHDLSKPLATIGPQAQAPSLPSPEGERRQATVMFSDLSGYTAMNERLDPEEVTSIMARFKEAAERIVGIHGGIVNQFVGDEVFALFGIPAAHEDDPSRAVRAALELHEAVRKLSDEIEARLGENLRLHSGINTGLVVTANDGGDARGGQYSVTGDTVNTAARLVSLAETDQILAGDSTRRQVSAFFDLDALEPVTVKGKARPLVPYRVLGASGVASRFEAAEQRGFTPYTGRESDRATLREALERTIAGEGQFITVSGDAGLGKSRLLYEFRHEIDRETVTVLQGRCQSFGQSTPYLPLTNALRQGLNLSDEDTPAELHAKTVASLRTIDPALVKFIPVILHLLSIHSSEYPLPEHLSGESLRQASQDALAAVSLGQTRAQPMVLILEDWHWADEASDKALRHLLSLLGGNRLMVVVNYRPEYQQGWESALNHQHLTLAPLNADHTAIIAKSVLEAARLPEGLEELIHQRTGGNPFFIEEVCLDLLEEGIVLVKDGQAALTRLAEKLNLPGTVQAVIRSRLDRLGEEQQEVLRLASVIGREFDHTLLAQAHRFETGKETDIAPVMKSLIGQNLVMQVHVLPEAAYIFKHVLTQVVVYETLLIERRKTLHGLVGKAMEETYADRLEEQYESLAHQYQHSDLAEKAIHYLELAGDKAYRNFSWVDARLNFQTLVEIFHHLDITPKRKAHLIDITLKWVASSPYAATWDHVAALETARQYAQDLEDQPRLAELTYWIGRFYYVLGHMGNEGITEFERAYQLAGDLNDERLQALSINFIGRARFFTTEYSKGIETLEHSIPLLKRLGLVADMTFSQFILAGIHGWQGNFEESYRIFETSIQGARGIRNPDRESHALSYFAMVKALQGDWDEAARLGQLVETMADSIGNYLVASFGVIIRGYAIYMQGRKDEGTELMERNIHAKYSDQVHSMYYIGVWVVEGLAMTREPEWIRELAKGFLRKEITGQRAGENVIHRALSMMSATEQQPDWEQAEEHIRESLQLSEQRSARPDLAISTFRYAEILHKKGYLPGAQKQLPAARALFNDMEMTWWAEQAEALRGRIERGEPFKGFAPYAD